MEYRSLGATGLTVSEIGMGTWELGGREWGDISEGDSIELLQYAFEKGVTLYDTSDQYGAGRSEKLLGQAFSGMEDKVVIATKVGLPIETDGWISRGGKPPELNTSRDYVMRAVEGSLKRLKRDILDVYQFHVPPSPEDWNEAFETMESLKSQEMIRFYGMCLGSAEQALKAIHETGISTMMLTYNIINQEMAEEVMAAAEEKGVGILGRQPLASGLLTGRLRSDTVFAENDYRKTFPREKFLEDLGKVDAVVDIVGDSVSSLPQAALKFILAHSAVSGVVPGMMTPAEVDDNVVVSSEVGPLADDIIERLRDL